MVNQLRTPLAKSPVGSFPISKALLPQRCRSEFVTASDLDELDPSIDRAKAAKRNFSEASALALGNTADIR